MKNSYEYMGDLEENLDIVEDCAEQLRNSAMLSYDPKIHRDFSIRCSKLLKRIDNADCSTETREFLKLRLLGIVEELIGEVGESNINISEIYSDIVVD